MTEFLHEKYKEFIRYNYGIQSGYCMYNNMEELMCDFATEVAKEYIEMASKLENELQAAIQFEDYERAAVIRDEIASIRKSRAGGNGK